MKPARDGQHGGAPPRAVAGDQATRLRAIMLGEGAGGAGAGQRTNGNAERAGHRRGGARTIAIASGKGGVGKTSAAVNLSIALSGMGVRTVLVDADLGAANADVLCGLKPRARLDQVIGTAQVGKARSLRDIAVEGPGGFRLIPGCSGIGRLADLPRVEREELVEQLRELESLCDVMLIDASAGIGRAVTTFVHGADLTIVVTTPEPTSITDAYALIKCVAGRAGASAGGVCGRVRVALLVNQAESEAEARFVHGRIAAVCDRFLGLRLPLLGWVAQDLRVRAAVRSRRPFVLENPRCQPSREMQRIAGVLIQQMGLRCLGASTARRAGSRLTTVLSRIFGAN